MSPLFELMYLLLESFDFSAESPSPVKEEPIWQGILSDLVTEKSGLVRLVAIAAYFEAMSPCMFSFCIPF